MRKTCIYLLMTVLAICLHAAPADDLRMLSNYRLSHIKSKDGLPHQQIASMAFDHSGRLWIGTRDGVAAYDGYSFTNYFHDPNDPGSLVHNFAKTLFVDSRGTLWVGTEKGLCRYVPETDSFRAYDIGGERVKCLAEMNDGRILLCGDFLQIIDPATDEVTALPKQDDGYVLSMAIAPDSRVFVATNKSIAYYDSKLQNCTFVNPGVYSDFLMGFDDIVPLFFDHRGCLWIGRNGKGVMSLDINTGQTEIYDVPNISDGTVRTIAEDPDHNIWIGTEAGINVINTSTGSIVRFVPDLVNRHRLNDNAIYSIVPDPAGNIWIGTYFGGINVMHRELRSFQWIAPGYDPTALPGKAIRRIVEPQPGKLWLASEDGGISIIDLASGRISTFDRISALGTNVHELHYDPSGNRMWIGTFRNGLFSLDMNTGATRHFLAGASGLASNAIFAIALEQAPRHRLWVGTTQGLRYYNEATGEFLTANHPVLDKDFIYSLLLDHHNNLWVGTVNNGLFRIDATTGEVKGWNCSDAPGRAGLHDCYVTAIFESSDGRIYIGTNNAGLHVIDADGNISLLSDEARSYGTICSMLEDDSKRIWVSTSRGLYRLSPDGPTLRFTTDDGLPENQFNFASALQGSDGRLYFGTVNGLVSFNPGISRGQTTSAPVHLQHLYINNREVSPSEEDSPLLTTLDRTDALHLDYNRSRSFSIDYGVVDPASAHAYSYQIYVDGIDKDWRDVGAQRHFTAMELAPGTYKLMLRAASAPEAWDNAPVRQLLIKIDPPFYFSTWAFIAYFILLVIVAYLIYRLFNLRMKEKEAIRISHMEKEKSEELNREKMELFTNISHELKTPLSLILAPLKYLSQHENLAEDSSKRLGIAITNTNKMVGLIDELVTFNRVESGNFQLYMQYGNPLTFIETVTRYFYEPAAEKDIRIHLYTENNGEDVWFSTTYVERILNNLLSNAIKYTQDGGEIDVRASIQEEEGDKLYLDFSVRDNGIGIAPEEIDNIFRKYYQTKRGYNTNNRGWGIGLATVKRLVEIHKGSITVDSTIGEGSTFHVRLDVTADAFDASCHVSNGTVKSPEPTYIRTLSTGSASTVTVPDYARKQDLTTILIVEDNPELLQFLSESFSRSYRVLTATNGVEALKIAGEYPPDIVVSDVMMPEMDGITLCEHLKNNLATSHIPVILLTAKNDAESTMKGFESGAEAYVAKPFDPQILELRIRNILRAHRKYLTEVMESSGTAVEPGSSEEAPAFSRFDQDFITRINEIIEKNIDNSEFSVSDITREFGISRSLLHIKMKSFFNQSMTDYIRKKRLAHACRLMKEGYNVSETAYRSGYSDPNYFTKVFKKEFGITPTEYLANQEAKGAAE